MREGKETSPCVHLVCKQHNGTKVFEHTHTPFTVWMSSSQTPCENRVIGRDEARGVAWNRKPVIQIPVLDCDSPPLSCAPPAHLSPPSLENNQSIIRSPSSVVHGAPLRLIGREARGVKWQSSPPQINTAVHQLGCHSDRLLPWRRAHPLLPLPARHRGHRLAPVLSGTRGKVSGFVWRAGRKLCVWVGVTRTVNAADFLVNLVHLWPRVGAGATAGPSGATGRSW